MHLDSVWTGDRLLSALNTKKMFFVARAISGAVGEEGDFAFWGITWSKERKN